MPTYIAIKLPRETTSNKIYWHTHMHPKDSSRTFLSANREGSFTNFHFFKSKAIMWLLVNQFEKCIFLSLGSSGFQAV